MENNLTVVNELWRDLSAIQAELEVPKDRNNAFGGFKYRKCEDILRAVKPLLHAHGIIILLSDEIVQFGEWVFVKATATIQRGDAVISCTAYARHADERKGMDAAQVTGSASSYARKYALSGLFGISDTDDPDDPPQAAPGIAPAPMSQIVRPAAPGPVPGKTVLPGVRTPLPGMPATNQTR